MRGYHKLGYPIVFLVGVLVGSGSAIWFDVPEMYPRSIELQVDNLSKPEWPGREVIESIQLDMYLWVVDPSKRYTLTLKRDDPDANRRWALDTVLKCLQESSVATTARPAMENSGSEIRLMFTEGRIARIGVHLDQYLGSASNTSGPLLVYDARTVERILRDYGTPAAPRK